MKKIIFAFVIGLFCAIGYTVYGGLLLTSSGVIASPTQYVEVETIASPILDADIQQARDSVVEETASSLDRIARQARDARISALEARISILEAKLK